jgi:FlaG/FlaF family flagellin (archaellin)
MDFIEIDFESINLDELELLFDDSDIEHIDTFIHQQISQNWDNAIRNKFQKTISLMNILLSERSALGGGDIDAMDNLVDMSFLDSTFSGADSDTFLQLMLQFNAIGDASEEYKVKKDKFETYLNSILAANIDIQAGGPVGGDEHNPSDPSDSAASYVDLLDDLLGNNRGHLSAGDIAGDRGASLIAAGLDIDVEDINFRILSSHTAELHGNFNDSGTDDNMVDLTILASGRDTILADVDHDNNPSTPPQGNFKITNNGALDVTDAYVIASADELYLRDEWNADTHAASYANPEPYQIEVENASLALASVDTMHLINVDITTQGSLAIGTLDDLNLRSTRPSDDNVFRVGHEGVRNEGLFLYASNELSLEDLRIEGKIDDIYMEATTINLKDVTFPGSAAVLLRSQLGGIVFDGYEAGRVNMSNVKHPAISGAALNTFDFDTSNKSFKRTSSGRPYVEVQSWGSGN